jgi:hypothetical protein
MYLIEDTFKAAERICGARGETCFGGPLVNYQFYYQGLQKHENYVKSVDSSDKRA